MRYVGVDPGQDGAAVVVGEDGQTVLAVQTWSRTLTPPPLTVLDDAAAIAVEGQHVHHAHASLVLAEWCGRLIAQLPPDLRLERPLAVSWRAKVFRGPALRRVPAKRIAIVAATPFLAAAGFHEPSHDLAEAWCIARWLAFYVPSHPLLVAEEARRG